MPGKYRDISRYLGLKVQANIVFRYRDIYTKGKWPRRGWVLGGGAAAAGRASRPCEGDGAAREMVTDNMG